MQCLQGGLRRVGIVMEQVDQELEICLDIDIEGAGNFRQAQSHRFGTRHQRVGCAFRAHRHPGQHIVKSPQADQVVASIVDPADHDIGLMQEIEGKIDRAVNVRADLIKADALVK